MAANFRSRMLHHGKISRVFSVFSPSKKLVNQRLVLARVSGQKGGKGEGGRKRRRKRGNRRLGRKEKGSFSKGSCWTPSPSSFFLSLFPFSSPFFIIFFFARPSPRETLFTRPWTVRVVGGAALIDIPRVPFRATIPDFISSDFFPLFFLRNEKSSAFRTRDSTNISRRRRFFEGTSSSIVTNLLESPMFSNVFDSWFLWNRGWWSRNRDRCWSNNDGLTDTLSSWTGFRTFLIDWKEFLFLFLA